MRVCVIYCSTKERVLVQFKIRSEEESLKKILNYIRTCVNIVGDKRSAIKHGKLCFTHKVFNYSEHFILQISNTNTQRVEKRVFYK